MREIKFRAWDKDKKILSPVWQISFRQWELEPDINSITLENDGTYEPINYIIEQYTGLKDKNGDSSCIYEGDIIDCHGRKVGNIHENEEMVKDKSNLVISGFGTSTWEATNKEAMDRGCYYSE